MHWDWEAGPFSSLLKSEPTLLMYPGIGLLRSSAGADPDMGGPGGCPPHCTLSIGAAVIAARSSLPQTWAELSLKTITFRPSFYAYGQKTQLQGRPLPLCMGLCLWTPPLGVLPQIDPVLNPPQASRSSEICRY